MGLHGALDPHLSTAAEDGEAAVIALSWHVRPAVQRRGILWASEELLSALHPSSRNFFHRKTQDRDQVTDV